MPGKSAGPGEKKKTGAPSKEARGGAAGAPRYVLRLYVTGTMLRSVRAIGNIKKICDEHLSGRYDLKVIDICRQPALAKIEQIVAVPMLVKELPSPARRFVGDMSDVDKVLLGLDLCPEG